jgi:HlyD family secretion protein
VLAAAGAAVAIPTLRGTPVTVARVVRGDAVKAVYATGTVEAVDRAMVKSRLSGTVIELRAREGDRIDRGDLLAVIDARSLELELARARAESQAAGMQAGSQGPQLAALEAEARVIEAELQQASRDVARLARLASEGTVAPVDVERMRTRVSVLESQLAANRAQRRALTIDLDARASGSRASAGAMAARVADSEVRSPIDGLVLSRLVEPGEVVAVNQPLFKVGDTRRLILECAVDEADVARVTPGQAASISLYAYPEVFQGVVREVLPEADRARRSFLVRVEFLDPPAGLRSGMTAEVNVTAERRAKALLVPADAVAADGTAWIVSGTRVRRRQVLTGVRDLAWVEIREGAAEGDLVVLSPDGDLADGDRVRAVVR